RRYERTPSRKTSSPRYPSIMRRTAAPLLYVIASNRSEASSAFFASTEIGCVDASASRLNALEFCATKSRQKPHSGLSAAVAFAPTKLANDSFSQRSVHHFIVTRSPHHMWVSSCAAVEKIPLNVPIDALLLSAARSLVRYVIAPGFSIAPASKSGIPIASTLASGYGMSVYCSRYEG